MKKESQSLKKSLAFSWKYTKNHRLLLFFSLFCQLLSVALGVAAPIVSARIIRAYANNEAWRVMYIALALLIIQLLRNLFLVISNQGYNRLYRRVLTALEDDLVRNVLKIEIRCMDEKGSGLFIQRLTTDTGRIAAGFNSLADMITQILNYVGIMIAMLLVSPLMFLLVLALMAVQSLIELYRTKRLKKDDRSFRQANEQFSGLVGEMIRGAKDVRLLNSEEEFASRLGSRISDSNDKRLYMQKRSWRMKLLRFEIGETGSFAVIAILAFLISQGTLLPSTALVLYNYYADLGPNAVKFLGTFLEFLSDFNLSNERVQALFDSPEFPRESFGTRELENPKGEITFEHVSFSYDTDENGPGRKVLDDMSFTIHSGETVAFVGKSGCGKTTTFNLISKLYTAQEGRVLLDGMDILELTKDSIRKNLTVVSQNPYIFHLTIRENLSIAKPDMSEDEMRQVCRLACIEEDILQMPQGYDSLVGEGGVNMSGGQRQRLAIARALLRNSPVILFDEATSALDNVTQAQIQTAIDNMRKNRTVILIAHRLSTIIHADQIFYMQDGRILAQGTHEELLASCPPYRELASMEGAGSVSGDREPSLCRHSGISTSAPV